MILVKYLFQILFKTVDESNSARVLIGCKPINLSSVADLPRGFASRVAGEFRHINRFFWEALQIKDIPFAVMMIICFSKLYTSNLFKITIKNCVFKHNFSVTSRYWRAWSIDFVSHASQTSQHSPIIRQNSVSISRPSGPTCMLQLNKSCLIFS